MVGATFAAYILVVVAVGTIGAFFFASESHSPLIITMMLTTFVSAAIAEATSTRNIEQDSLETANRDRAATFIFVNSAGTVVGLVTNLSEAIERGEMIGPNGLTFLYEHITQDQIPLSAYVLILLLLATAASLLIWQGRSILTNEAIPTEKRLNALGGSSATLLAIWIFACMRWERLAWGSEQVAFAWTIAVYGMLLLVCLVFYGHAAIRLLLMLPQLAAHFAQESFRSPHNRRKWKLIFSILSSMIAGTFLALLLIYFVVEAINQIEDSVLRGSVTVIDRFLESYVKSIFVVVLILGKVLLVVFCLGFLICLLKLLQVILSLATKTKVEVASYIQSLKREFQLNRRPKNWLFASFATILSLSFRVVTRRRDRMGKVLAMLTPLGFVLAASTNGYAAQTRNESEAAPTIVVIPPTNEISPLSLPVFSSIDTIAFEAVSICDFSLSSVEWAYARDDRLSIDISKCRIQDSASSIEAILLVSMATQGSSAVEEEARSLRRLNRLAHLATEYLNPEVQIFGLDLGMAMEAQSHFALQRTFGMNWDERSIVGLSIEVGGDGDERMDTSGALQLFLQHSEMIESSYSQCKLLRMREKLLEPVADCGRTE